MTAQIANRRMALALALSLAACGGGYGNAFVPRAVPAVVAASAQRHHRVHVYVRMRIPRRDRNRHDEYLHVHPATISPLTQSVTFAVNGETPQSFNATRSSPGCGLTPTGTLCTFGISAPPGSDTFVVSTYSAVGAGGTILDRGTAVVNVVAGQANSFQITLGPVVSNTADGGMGSLRYAVANASPNDTIVFELPANSTIGLSSVITPAVSLSISGPGVTTSLRPRVNRHGVHSNTTYSGVTIDGGGLVQIFSISSTVKVTISGLVLSNGAALVSMHPGGAIGNSGTLTLADDAIIDSVSPFAARHLMPVRPSMRDRLRPHCIPQEQDGGGIFNAGSLTVTDSFFDGNVVSDNCEFARSAGGAIFNAGGGTLTVTGSTFANNLGERGGAVFNEGIDRPTFDHDTFVGNSACGPLNGCPSTGCSGSGCVTYPSGAGAAIYDDAEIGAVITNSTFTDNVAGGKTSGSQGEGGALLLYGGSYTISGDTFTGNAAGGGSDNCSSGSGGAIYDLDSFHEGLELDGDVFSNNRAGGDTGGVGGAVATMGSLSGNGDTFSTNSATGTGSACSGNGVASGGATSSAALALNASTFTGNAATANQTATGGAITFTGQGTLDNDVFSSNASSATGADGATGPMVLGGAVYMSSGAIYLTSDAFGSNSVSTGSVNGTSVMGGALATGSTSTVISSNDTFSANAATETAGTNGAVAGGAIAAGSFFTSVNDTFTNNAAKGAGLAEGGGAFVEGDFNVQSDAFSGNGSGSDKFVSLGGALAVTQPGTIKSSTFTANGASSTVGDAIGGALFDEGGTHLDGVTIANNTAKAGAGIFAEATELIDGSSINGNAASGGPLFAGGGGIYGDGELFIVDTTIDGNSATTTLANNGGGGVLDGAGLFMSDTTVSGNSVNSSGVSGGGGGIFNQNGAQFGNDTIVGNTSNLDGGGVFTFDPSNQYQVIFVNVTLYQNKATQAGGNIYNPTPGIQNHQPEVTLLNTILAGGSASMGPDIYNVNGGMESLDYNIIGSAPPYGSGFTTFGVHDKTATDPQLLPLTNNGGPTFTLADQSTSPGKGMIPYAGGCGPLGGAAIDQRGYTRGSGGVCDAGAYEFAGVASAITSHRPKPHFVHATSSLPRLHIPRVRVPSIPMPSTL